MRNSKIKKLTACAILIALATVLSMVIIWKMPLGGSVTLFSMIPIVLISFAYGIKWGLVSSFIYSLIQLGLGIVLDGVLGWGLTPLSLLGTIMLDYVLAYTILGFAGIFVKKSKYGILFGTIIVIVIRFLLHVLSGAIIFDIWCEWDNVWIYSICYNGSFMLPELITTVMGVFGLSQVKAIQKLINQDS